VDDLARRRERDGVVVLLTRREDAGLHCQVTAFFSPAAAELAMEAGAVSCAAPPRRGLAFAAGDPDWEDALFGSREGG
jgi:hypothetical protein